MTSRRRLLALALAAGLLPLVATTASATERVRIGVMSGAEEEIWQHVKPIAAQEGIDLEIVTFNDYVQPNAALDAGDLDANAFQHQPYLDNQIASRGYHIVAVGKTFVSPIGLYSSKLKSVADIADGATVAIPNDPSNGGRGLLLLQAQGLLKVKPGTGITPSVADITDNPKNLRILELDAAQLPRALGDVDAAVINSNYALDAGLDPTKDAIAQESAQNNPYANLIAVRAPDKDKPLYAKLVHAYQTPEIAAFLKERFKGALLPAW
jgi:D-methionine transport system substrate-binding protein